MRMTSWGGWKVLLLHAPLEPVQILKHRQHLAGQGFELGAGELVASHPCNLGLGSNSGHLGSKAGRWPFFGPFVSL